MINVIININTLLSSSWRASFSLSSLSSVCRRRLRRNSTSVCAHSSCSCSSLSACRCTHTHANSHYLSSPACLIASTQKPVLPVSTPLRPSLFLTFCFSSSNCLSRASKVTLLWSTRLWDTAQNKHTGLTPTIQQETQRWGVWDNMTDYM